MSKYGISKDAWMAVVGKRKVTPALVTLAASLCPEILKEKTLASSVDEKGKVTWMPFASLAAAEQSDIAIECHGDNASIVIRNALAEWTMSHKDAEVPLRALAKWDRKLGVWCACAVAETALKHVPAGENRPRVAIETTRSWVMGRATIDNVRNAYSASSATATAAYTAYAYTAAYAAYSASSATYTAAYYAAAHAASAYAAASAAASAYAASAYAASNATYATSEWERIRNAELARLCEVIAQAIINYPTDEMVEPSRGLSAGAIAAGLAGAALGAGLMYTARKL